MFREESVGHASVITRLKWKLQRVIKRIRGDCRPENSNMYKWAKAELERLIPEDDDDGMQQMINKDILNIVKVFCSQGHSGTTGNYTLSMINRLLDWKPLTPLTGEESEWSEVIDGSDLSQQNKRCSAVFRRNYDNSTAYYLYGKVFSDDGGQSWFINGESHIPITFPFTVPAKPEKVLLK